MSKKLKTASFNENMHTKSSETDLDADPIRMNEDSSVTWLKKIFEVLNNISVTQNEILQEMRKKNDSNSNQQKESACITRDKEENWDTLIMKRKHAYYQKLRSSDTKTIYSSFLEKQPPFILQKFRENLYPEITEKQKENKNKLEKMKLEIEIDRLNEEEEKILTLLKRLMQL